MSAASDDVVGERAPRRPVAPFLTLLVAVSLVVHVPGLIVRLFNSDEASLATMAMVIDHGGTLYRQTADRKPPVVPYLYAAMFKATGSRDLRPVRALGALSLALTAYLLAVEARRRFRRPHADLWCAGLFLLGTVTFFPPDTQASGFEVFMLLPMTAAFIAAGRGQPARAGLWLAAACLCKQTALTTALPVTYLLYRQGGWRPVIRAHLATAGVILGAALVFGPARFILWTVTGNGGYLRLHGSMGAAALRGLAMSAIFLGVNGVIVALCTMSVLGRRAALELKLWALASALAVLVGMRFFGHYYLQLLPPLALLAAGTEVRMGWARRAAVAGVVVPSTVFVALSFLPSRARGLPVYQQVAARVKALTQPDDTVFVWGQYPELYWASNREPATRFIHTGFVTGNTGGRPPGSGEPDDGVPGSWAMLEADLVQHPPDLVLDTSPADLRGSQYYPLKKTILWSSIKRGYRETTEVDGVVFYRRRQPPLHGVASSARVRPARATR